MQTPADSVVRKRGRPAWPAFCGAFVAMLFSAHGQTATGAGAVDPPLPEWRADMPAGGPVEDGTLPDVLGELDGLQLAEPPPAWPDVGQDGPEALAYAPVVPDAGSPGSPVNTWWLSPTAWNDIDSSTRIPAQILRQWDGQLETPLMQDPPLLAAPDSGPPDEAKEFPVQPFIQLPLGNLSSPRALAANRAFRLGSTRVRYGVGIDASFAHNNNVFGTATDTQSDFTFTLTPSILLEAGTKSTVRILYAPSIVKYARFKQFDAVNQTFLFNSRLRTAKIEVGLDAGYLTQSGLFLGSQGQSDLKTLQAEVFARYALTRKTNARVEAAWRSVTSDPGGQMDGISFGGAVEYRYSPKTTVGAAMLVGSYLLPQGNTHYQDFLLRLRYAPTAKLIFNGEGGIQFRQSKTDQGTGFSTYSAVLNAKLEWLATRKSMLALRLFRNTAVDPFAPDTLQTLTGAELEATWQITKRAKLEAILVTGYAENSSLAGVEGQDYFFNTGTLSLLYFPRDGMRVRMFTSLQQRFGDSNPESNYLSNTTGMELGLGF